MWQPHGAYLFSPTETLRSVIFSPENAILADTVSSLRRDYEDVLQVGRDDELFREHSYLRCLDDDVFCIPTNIPALARTASAVYTPDALYV
jgi:hypothetical protein